MEHHHMEAAWQARLWAKTCCIPTRTSESDSGVHNLESDVTRQRTPAYHARPPISTRRLQTLIELWSLGKGGISS